MNQPLPARHRPGERLLSAATSRVRRPPTPAGIARRRFFVTVSKFLLPVAGLALLTSIALWPEIKSAKDQARMAFRRFAGTMDGGQIIRARYHGIDERNRPYTITAATAVQVSEERVNLTTPKGDVTLQNGTWMMLEAKRGVFIQHQNMLDLEGDVFLYRDDGTTMRSATATIDLKNGAASSADTVHAEGPFGTLDATGFAVTDKGAVAQFPGPARLMLNAHEQ
ncbi:MAG: LPS export ABC transporter periplasmic protein LptC [Alphaproteobacteria bacterium]|nr:LPS export ABC transporter periplasmic protein LptC [Alphaproteobacteria bacterium]